MVVLLFCVVAKASDPHCIQGSLDHDVRLTSFNNFLEQFGLLCSPWHLGVFIRPFVTEDYIMWRCQILGMNTVWGPHSLRDRKDTRAALYQA
jgi:hypothetical protein